MKTIFSGTISKLYINQTFTTSAISQKLKAHRNLNRNAVDKTDKAAFCSLFLSETSYFRQVEQI